MLLQSVSEEKHLCMQVITLNTIDQSLIAHVAG